MSGGAGAKPHVKGAARSKLGGRRIDFADFDDELGDSAEGSDVEVDIDGDVELAAKTKMLHGGTRIAPSGYTLPGVPPASASASASGSASVSGSVSGPAATSLSGPFGAEPESAAQKPGLLRFCICFVWSVVWVLVLAGGNACNRSDIVGGFSAALVLPLVVWRKAEHSPTAWKQWLWLLTATLCIVFFDVTLQCQITKYRS